MVLDKVLLDHDVAGRPSADAAVNTLAGIVRSRMVGPHLGGLQAVVQDEIRKIVEVSACVLPFITNAFIDIL